MKIKLSEYIADFLVQHEVKHIFTITGGGAMHLNDSLGHKRGLACVYRPVLSLRRPMPDSRGRLRRSVLPAALGELMPLPECLADGWIPFQCS